MVFGLIIKAIRRLSAVALAAGWLCHSFAVAQTDLRALFPRQAPIFVTGSGLSKLDLPVEVVAEVKADRSDLRILDAQGAETPFMIDVAMRATPSRRIVMRHALEIVDVDRGRCDRRDGPPVYDERYVLAMPSDVDAHLVWDLVFETPRPEFVRRVRVTALATGSEAALTADASLFRLPSPARERLRITLPRFLAPRLAVSIEGEDSSYLEPVFRLEHSYSVAPPEQDRLVLPIVNRRDEDRQTILELDRPRGIRPSSLVLETSAAAFSRTVEVWDEGQGASAKKIGRNDLYRVPGSAELEELNIPLNPAAGNRLRVVIDNGDSPPLADIQLTAVSQRVTLLFTLPSRGGTEPSGELLFGGGRARAPQYDLARLQTLLHPPQPNSGASSATDLYESSPARLGPISQHTAFGGSPTLSFAMRPGSAVDARLYTHRRTVHLEPSADGLSLVPLTIEDLAKAQPDLRDVRIVDRKSLQWAYIAEQDASSKEVALAIRGPERENGVSEYTLTPPAAPATLSHIDLTVQAEFFDRAFELYGVQGERTIPLVQGRLQHRAGDPARPPIEANASRIDSLKLRIHDGDDAALGLIDAVGQSPAPKLYVAAPAGDYTLLMGNEKDIAPSYELSQVRAAVLAASGNEARLGDLEANPTFSAPARLAVADGPQHVLLWGALIAAVGGLSLVTLRMVRRTSDPANPGGDGKS